jgi:hypothetical protein
MTTAAAAIASVEAWALIAAIARPVDLARAACASRALADAVRGARELNADWDVRARHLDVVPAASVVRLRIWQIPRARLCVLSDELPVARLLPGGRGTLPGGGCPRLQTLHVHAVRAVPTAWARALAGCPVLREVRVVVERDSLAGLDALVTRGAPRLERLSITTLGPRRLENMAVVARGIARPHWAPVTGDLDSDTLLEYENDVHAYGLDAPVQRLRVRDFESTPCLERMRGRTLAACRRLEWSTPWARLPAAFAFAACEDLDLDVRAVWSLQDLAIVVGWLAQLRARMPALRWLTVRVELASVDRAYREVRVPPGAFAGIQVASLRLSFPPLGFVKSLAESGAAEVSARFDEPLTADLRRDLDEMLENGAQSDDEDLLELRARIEELEEFP